MDWRREARVDRGRVPAARLLGALEAVDGELAGRGRDDVLPREGLELETCDESGASVDCKE